MPRKLNTGTDALSRRPPDNRQIEETTEASSKWQPDVTKVIDPEATCVATVRLGTIDSTTKELQNDSITLKDKLFENERSKRELLSSMPDVTDIESNSIVTNVTSASVFSILTNVAIMSGNGHPDISSKTNSNVTNAGHTDVDSIVTEISGSVEISAYDTMMKSIILSMTDRLEMNATLRLSQSSLLLDDIRNNYQNDPFYSKVVKDIDTREIYFMENGLLYTRGPHNIVICVPRIPKLIQAILK